MVCTCLTHQEEDTPRFQARLSGRRGNSLKFPLVPLRSLGFPFVLTKNFLTGLTADYGVLTPVDNSYEIVTVARLLRVFLGIIFMKAKYGFCPLLLTAALLWPGGLHAEVTKTVTFDEFAPRMYVSNQVAGVAFTGDGQWLVPSP